MVSSPETTTPTIRQLAASDEREYLRFLLEADDSLLYYSLAYRRFLEDLLGCKSAYYLAVDGSRILGALPLMERDGPLGRVINSLPYFGSNGGVLAATEPARQALLFFYNELVRASNVGTATIVGHPLRPDANRDALCDFTDQRIGQISSLEGLAGSDPSLLSMIDGSARRNIKKAEQSGITVEIDADAMGFLEDTHRDNMREIGGKSKAPEFFAKIPKHFAAGRDYDIYIAQRDGRKLAALLIFYFNKTVEYFTPVSRAEARELQPTAAILRRAMLDAASRGFTRWNWGGTWLSQEGVYRFKKKWGAEDRPYQYYVKVNNKAVLHASKQDLIAAYPDFFVVPFGAITELEKGSTKP